MKKLLKMVLWGLALVAFVFAVCGVVVGYDLYKLRSNADDIVKMKEYLTEICFRQRGDQGECKQQIIQAYVQCFSPFMADKKRSACFEQAATSVNQQFRPELARPNKSFEGVTAWAAKAAPNILNFGYDDYEDKLDHARKYFSSAGWASFSQALKDSHMIEDAKAKKLHIQLKLLGKPEIKNVLVESGIYTWFLQFPIEIDFTGESPPQPIRALLVLHINRVSSYESPDGLGIVQWVTVNGP